MAAPRCGVFVVVGAAHPAVIGIIESWAFVFDMDVLSERHKLTYDVKSTCANKILFYA